MGLSSRCSVGAEEREFPGWLLGLSITTVAISFRGEEWGEILPLVLHPLSVRCP